MSDLRSRAAVVGICTGAATMLAVPVVAFGQVPGVSQVVGGVNQAAQDVVHAAPALPVQAPAPAPAPAPKPAAPVRAPAPAPKAPAPAPAAAAPTSSSSAQRGAPASTSQRSGGSAQQTGGASAQASGKSGKPAGHRLGAKAHAAADEKKASSSAGGAPTDTQIADDPASQPQDASTATLPFTGFQLAMVALTGLVAVAVGAALRRGVRTRRA